MDEETTKGRIELYTGWLQEWVKDLPDQITIQHKPAAHTTIYRWAIYRGNYPEKVVFLHPGSVSMVGLPPAEARQFLHQALKTKLMEFKVDTSLLGAVQNI
jgi:hypothetical protein